MYEPLGEGAENADGDDADDVGVFAAPLHTDNGLLLLVTPFQVTEVTSLLFRSPHSPEFRIPSFNV